jgi:N-acetylneuraminic acid mutarotase
MFRGPFLCGRAAAEDSRAPLAVARSARDNKQRKQRKKVLANSGAFWHKLSMQALRSTQCTSETLPTILPTLNSAIWLAAVLLLAVWPARAEQYHGNGDAGFGGAIGRGTLTLSDDGTNILGTLAVGGSMNDVLVLYIQTGPGGFTNTSGFNDQADACRQAISGVSASGRSLLTFASDFQPNYAIALAPAAAGTGGLWQLANGGNNSLVYLGSVNLAPLNTTGPYAFSFPAALIGMIPGVRSTIQVFGTYVRTDGYRSTEAIAGNLTGAQGWNPFTQTASASYTFDTGAVLVKLSVGLWARQTDSSPTGRDYHTAVWTGSEMIVWGGYGWNGSGFSYSNDGGRYNPAANSWTALFPGAPTARGGHTAVWTGSEVIVWGGASNTTYYANGRRYNPASNRWTAVATTGAPSARGFHTAVWTGTEMIVWGGSNGSNLLNDGGRYNPTANSWTALPTAGTPGVRAYHTAIWTGTEMIVWGGHNNSSLNDGGRYSPAANSWAALPTTGAPAGREGHTTVWTGNEMIIWGGAHDIGLPAEGYFNDGGRYNPVADSWTALPTAGAPSARQRHTAVWTGSEMIIWGGGFSISQSDIYFNDGGRYDPAANGWTAAVPTDGAPAARYAHKAVWTGTEMIVWGGYNEYNAYDGRYLNDGGRYNPTANAWTMVPIITAPAGRTLLTAVWTGGEMIVWGGQGGAGYVNDGGRYNPAANTWTAVATSGAPAARTTHTAVWTGSEMIIWGGGSNTTYYADGGRYDPAANSWAAVPASGAPAARGYHTAVWTGSEMIVWGGYNGSAYSSTGGRYNPVNNTWTPVITSGAPPARAVHTAVWTGSEMIVWGGYNGSIALNSGGRYNPADNSWGALTAVGAPTARDYHTAVWTGSDMIIWGGYSGSSTLNSGGRYNPAGNNWTALSTTGAPAGRYYHTAIWTGGEMIVWGGYTGSSYFKDGGRYHPAANSWTAVPSTGAPDGRYGHRAVWTGSAMIVFGGYSNGVYSYPSDTWSYYPYAPAVRISRSGSTSADIAWPVWHPTLRLCQTTNLAASQWTTVTNDVTQVGSENRVTVSPLSGREFFRAEYP